MVFEIGGNTSRFNEFVKILTQGVEFSNVNENSLNLFRFVQGVITNISLQMQASSSFLRSKVRHIYSLINCCHDIEKFDDP